jgi:hypothetical protein
MGAPIVAERSLAPENFPALTAKRRSGSVAGTPSLRLWTNLDSKRHLSSDAHALAWRDAQLSPLELRCLTVVCHTEGRRCVNDLGGALHTDIERTLRPCLGALLERGWMDELNDEWRATEAGKEARMQIELATNAYTAPVYRTLDQDERDYLLSILSSLPSA